MLWHGTDGAAATASSSSPTKVEEVTLRYSVDHIDYHIPSAWFRNVHQSYLGLRQEIMRAIKVRYPECSAKIDYNSISSRPVAIHVDVNFTDGNLPFGSAMRDIAVCLMQADVDRTMQRLMLEVWRDWRRIEWPNMSNADWHAAEFHLASHALPAPATEMLHR